MLKIAGVSALLGILLIAQDARADGEFYTGNDLWADCTSDVSAARTFCMGYIIGTIDTVPLTEQGMSICVPSGVTMGQMRDVTKAFLQENAKYRHKPAAGLVLAALRVTYPCRIDQDE